MHIAGAGAIISQGAMRLASFDAVEQFLEQLPWHSGDAMLTEAMWHVLKLAPTDPGAHLQLCLVIVVKLLGTMTQGKAVAWPNRQQGLSSGSICCLPLLGKFPAAVFALTHVNCVANGAVLGQALIAASDTSRELCCVRLRVLPAAHTDV